MIEPGRTIGNTPVVEALRRIARSPGLGHAYLLYGPEGVGKRRAALEFARAINCTCEDAGICESCKLMKDMKHPEVLFLEDAGRPRWLARHTVFARLGEEADTYADIVESLASKGYLEEPLPRPELPIAVDGFSIATAEIFGRGSVPSREAYTPVPVSERLRKEYESGDLSPGEFKLLQELYEYPLSAMPYRGAIPIAYITTRKGWKFVRAVQPFLSMRTMLGGKKVVIIDDAHRMSPEAQNCLLKTLEEPPADSVLVLVTSDRRSMFATIVSRCQNLRFTRLSGEEMDLAIRQLGANGGQALRLLAENSPGRYLELAMQDIETRLEQTGALFSEFLAGHPEAVFAFSRRVLDGAGSHRARQRQAVKQALELILFWLVQVMRARHGSPALDGPLGETLSRHAGEFSEEALLTAASEIEKTFGLIRFNVDLGLLLEAVLLKLGLGRL
jgi:DNA polymerase III delta prime subunit